MLRNQQFVNQVLELTNQFRAQNGLSALKLNEELTVTAELHSIDMAENDYMEHTGLDGSMPWDRAALVGFESNHMAENIAGGQNSPSEVVQAWIDSPGHRANLLSANYTEMGVGYYEPDQDTGDQNYWHYWTQLFGSSDRNAATYLSSPFATTPAPIPVQSPAPVQNPIPTPVPISIPDSAPISILDSSRVPESLNPAPVTDSDINDEAAIENNIENDILIGTRSNDILMGNAGNSTLMGLNGRDFLRGGLGSDMVNGGGRNDRLLGGEGEDILIGGGGRDRLVGGAGNDVLTGGGGGDLFVFGSSRAFNIDDLGIDQITDFRKGDKIVLDRTTFGSLTSQQIAIAKDDQAAETSDGKIAYSQATGKLFFNSNGLAAGFGAGGQFALVDSDKNLLTLAPRLAIADFQIVA